MKNYTWLILTAGLFTAACDGGKETGDPVEADADTDTDTDADTDTDPEPIEHSYTSYEGWESLDYNDGTYGAGEFNCQGVWDLSGSAVSPMDADCEGCEFLFDVTYSLRDASYVYDDGTCGLADSGGTYGYSSSFDGYGASWVYSSYGTYYWWGYGEFAGSDFVYYYGYTDYPYYGAYYSYYQYGAITVQ